MERILEHRSLNQFPEMEARAEAEDEIIKISGYGAVFSRWYPVWDFQERIMPGAFDKTLQENPDIRGMFNHSPEYLLGRTKSGTMEVGTDKKGLWYVIRADAQDPQAISVSRKIIRGDVDGSSMAMRVIKDEWEEKDGRPVKRSVLEIGLVETGPVTMPASPTTTAKIQRALQDTGIDHDAITGIVVKKRAGFDPTGSEEAHIEKAIRALEALRSEPERIAPHSDVSSTALRVAALRMELDLAASFTQ